MSTTFQDHSAFVRFERRHPDLREEIQIMAEAERWSDAAAAAPQPSLFARLWGRRSSTTRLAA